MNLTVEVLWEQIEELEKRPNFYPDGMCEFPFKLTGQGFFPGGDGLWRDGNALDAPSSGILPVGGIVFLGNDFGTHASFLKLAAKGYENPLTWRHLKKRIASAGLPTDRVFCTNAILGLRRGDQATALAKSNWHSAPAFLQACTEFLDFQLRLLQPRLLVTLGPVAGARVSALPGLDGHRQPAILRTTHPYADFSFTEARKTADAQALAAAWHSAASVSENG